MNVRLSFYCFSDVCFSSDQIDIILFDNGTDAAANNSKKVERWEEVSHRVNIFTIDETGLVCLPTQLERTPQLYW
jgi:hypothetical protein